MTRGVVLLQMGGPDSLEAIRPYLRNLFSDSDIIKLPLAPLTQPLFASYVSAKRAEKVAPRYAQMGGASPLNPLTEAQRAALEEQLASSGDWRVYTAMRYWHPFAGEALEAMSRDGVDSVVIVPLFPQYCTATTQSSLNDLARAARAIDSPLAASVVRAYPDDPAFVAALAAKVRQVLPRLAGAPAHVLFSAHGVPESIIACGDPYARQIDQTVTAVVAALGDVLPAHSVAYQSRVGRQKWLEPNVVDAVRRLGASGVKALAVVPVTFVSDHIETLVEIDRELAETARSAGIEVFVRSETLNDDPLFISALRDLVLTAAERDAVPLGELDRRS